MSQTSIGGKIRNTLVGILIGLLVLAFAVWGVNDVFTPNASNSVIEVGDTKVSAQEFDEAFSRELAGLARESGQGLTNQEAYNRGIHSQILQRMVTDAVISEDADDLGIGVNRRDARKFVESIDAFKNELTGQFSEDKLENILAQNRMSRTQFEKDTLRGLRRDQTVPAIVGGIEAPAEFASRYFDFISEQRRATILTLNEAAIDPIENPTDEALKAYIDENGASYMAPEYRSFIMLRLEPFDFARDLTVSEEELKDAFNYRIELGKIGSPETRDVTLVSANDEETAKQAASRMAGGEVPANVAAALGLDSPDYFTEVKKNGLVEPESGTAAFELGEGEAKAILNSLGRWTAVYVPSITEAVVPNFEDGKEELSETLLNEKAQDQLYDIVGQIEDAMTEGMTLEEIAKDLNIAMQEFDFIDRSGTTQDGLRMTGFDRIPGVATDDVLLKEIFTSDIGFETDIFETSTGGYASIRVEDIIDTKMRPFEDVKTQALIAWKDEQIEAALTEKSLTLQAELRNGKSFEAMKAELGEGAELREVGLARVTPPRDIGPRVVVELLDGQPGDFARGEGILPKTYHIARLDRIQPNQDGLAGQFLDVLQERVSAELSADVQNAYQQAVLKENELRQYPDKVRSALGLDQPAE